MPKRSTTTFTSEDAPAAEGPQLHVYYCKFSGEHCLITDVRLSELPRRRTDGALILDTQAHVVRLKGTQQPPKLVKRAEEHYEKQFRYHTQAQLPYAYKTEAEGQHLYILEGALSSYARGDGAAGERVPVPPCIQRSRSTPDAVQVAISLEERSKAASLLRISADEVSVAVTQGSVQCAGEVLDLMAKVLGTKHSQLSLSKGWNERSKMLLVAGMTQQQVYGKLTAWLADEADRARGKGY